MKHTLGSNQGMMLIEALASAVLLAISVLMVSRTFTILHTDAVTRERKTAALTEMDLLVKDIAINLRSKADFNFLPPAFLFHQDTPILASVSLFPIPAPEPAPETDCSAVQLIIFQTHPSLVNTIRKVQYANQGDTVNGRVFVQTLNGETPGELQEVESNTYPGNSGIQTMTACFEIKDNELRVLLSAWYPSQNADQLTRIRRRVTLPLNATSPNVELLRYAQDPGA